MSNPDGILRAVSSFTRIWKVYALGIQTRFGRRMSSKELEVNQCAQSCTDLDKKSQFTLSCMSSRTIDITDFQANLKVRNIGK